MNGDGLPSAEERDALVPARNGKLAGTVLLCAAIVAAGLALWMLRELRSVEFEERAMAFAAPAALALIAAFCCWTGWRLLSRRRDETGPVVGMRGWYALSVAFAVFGALLVFGLSLDEIPSERLAFAIPIACCFLLSYWCYHLGRNAARRP
jgi:hypothetical protein